MHEKDNKSRKFWDRSAKRYDRLIDEDDDLAIFTLERSRKYLQPTDVVLDFGCATGRNALEIAAEAEEIWGIDISTEMIRTAKGNTVKSGISNIHFMQAEINDSRLENESFNVVLANNILHLINDPLQAAVRIGQLLKPGGIFISVTPCLGAARSLTTAAIKLSGLLGMVPQTRRFKPEDVESLIHEAHYELIETKLFEDQIPAIFIASRRCTS